ncbi:MAG: hypothetical protein JXQ71_08805 [Verrucomicrobia bacterium]|nr:hypothetical protein [Verrucomicrobiota bacterium]
MSCEKPHDRTLRTLVWAGPVLLVLAHAAWAAQAGSVRWELALDGSWQF